VLSTRPTEGVSGWDVKPSLMLQELDAGWPDVLWLDDDMIVTRSLTALLKEFPDDSVIVAEEWNRAKAIPVSHYWELQSVRPLRVMNACFVRATQAHRPLLQRWLQLIHDPRYREAQTLSFERRPLPLATDGWLLAALLESEEFGDAPCDYIRLGRHIAQ